MTHLIKALLGSAAGLVAVAGAQAADLPSRKAAPADYVRICSVHGRSFFYIPGTETCLRVGGRVRAEYLVGQNSFDVEDNFGFRARGRLNIDARTATPYGTLRTFFRYEVTSNSGQYRSLGRVQQDRRDLYETSVELDKAFIQFAGFTAGKIASFFDFGGFENWFDVRGTSGENTSVLAYTASFGSGYSATLSLEDGASRRNAGPGLLTNPLGREYPDIVGVLRADQSWGSAQLMGALHQVRGTAGSGILTPYNQTGYAIGAGIKINLPQLARGDYLAIEVIYAKGALNYMKVDGDIGALSRGAIRVAENYANPTGGSSLTSAFVIAAHFQHYWTPTVRQSVFGSYLSVDQGNPLQSGRHDLTEWRVGTQVVWEPVRDLDIGVEVLYRNVEGSSIGGAGLRLAPGVAVPAGSKFRDDSWAARLRIERNF
jgi:hypothetical protein